MWLHDGKRTAVIVGGLVLALIAFVLVREVHHRGKSPGTSLPLPALTGKSVASPDKVPAETNEVEWSVESAADKTTGVPPAGVTVDGKSLEQLKAEGVVIRFGVEASLEAVNGKRLKVAREVTPYHVAESDLKKAVKAKYGPFTADNADQLVKVAAGLEDAFWDKGDFDDPQNMSTIYDARAILESCLEVAPDNENVLRQICQVIQAGWPRSFSGSDESIKWEDEWQRAYDLYIPLKKLWQEHLSRHAASTIEDMAVAADLASWTFVGDSGKAQYLDQFRKGCPNPSPELLALVDKGVPVADRIAIAKWALEGAQKQGGKWLYYADQFQKAINFLEGKTTRHSAPNLTLFYDRLLSDKGDYDASSRFFFGRGSSFAGPAVQKSELVPMHEWLHKWPQ